MTEESLKKELSFFDCTKLKQIILENPDLPMLITTNLNVSDYLLDSYSTVFTPPDPYIDELTFMEDKGIWVTREEYREILEEDLADSEEYQDLSDEEFFKKIDEIVEKTVFVKTIIVYLSE